VAQPFRPEKAARSLGFHVQDTAPPIPSKRDPETVEEGLRKRVGGAVPELDGRALRRFRNFVRKYIREHYQPLGNGVDLSVPTWLDGTHYTLKQKDDLLFRYVLMTRGNVSDREYWFLSALYGQGTKEQAVEHYRENWRGELRECLARWDKHRGLKVKSFIKAEPYSSPGGSVPVFKHARWINSPPSELKLLFGPLCKAMETYVFHREPAFIKLVPVDQRSQYIHDMMAVPQGTYYATDYSTFESSFVPKMIKSCELQLYRYLCRNNPDAQCVIDVVGDILTGKRRLINGSVKAVTSARMSGDMCTSLGNGFTNLMVSKFWAHINGFEFCGVVEGDDGLFRVPSRDLVPPKEFYSKLGFMIKLDEVARLNEGGFCQNYYAEGEPENLRNPIPIILKAGWTLSRRMHGGPEVMRELARSKGNSIICETPACPVLGSFARYLLRATEGSMSSPAETWWQRERDAHSRLDVCVERASRGPTAAQRKFVADQWSLSIDEQLSLEAYFDGLNDLRVLAHPVLALHVAQRYSAWSVMWHINAWHEPAGSAW
jgi:hypothetical protein